MPDGRIKTYLFPGLVFWAFCIGLLVVLVAWVPGAAGILALPLFLALGFLAVCLFDFFFGGGSHPRSAEDGTFPPSDPSPSS